MISLIAVFRRRAKLRDYLPGMFAALITVSSATAENGNIFPDSAGIRFTYSVNLDTVRITIENLSEDVLENMFFSDFTESPAVVIGCEIDGLPADSLISETDFGSVYPGKYSSRWLIGNVSDSLILRYFSQNYGEYLFSFSAGCPFPVFGTAGEIRIEPPLNLRWRE